MVLPVLCLSLEITYAQQFDVGLGYQYLYASQWDKAIQTYNFSRPFLKEEQPLLVNGFHSQIQYIFKSKSFYNSGIRLSHGYFRSRASNDGFDVVLNLQFLNVGYVLHYDNPQRFKNLYAELALLGTGSLLKRRVNGETFPEEGDKLRAFGFGGEMDLVVGYRYPLRAHPTALLSLFAGVGYTPYLVSSSESVLNQTKSLSGTENTSLITWKVGIKWHILRKTEPVTTEVED